MSSLIEAISSPGLAGHARRAYGLSGDGLASIYLHQSGGRISIGGGVYGSQWIDSLAIDPDLVEWLHALVRAIDVVVDLDFRMVDARDDSNIDFYVDTEILIESSDQVLGLAIPNSSSSRSWWELIINGPKILGDSEYLYFAIVHELGHALGLEHPFDKSDGDFTGSAFAAPDADVTVMSYTKPSGGWPSFFQSADLTALVGLWGLEDDLGSRDWLLQTVSDGVIKLDTQAARSRLALDAGDLLLGLAPEGWAINAVPKGGPDRFQLSEDGVLMVSFEDLIVNDRDPEGAPLRVVEIAGFDLADLTSGLHLDGAFISVDPRRGFTFVPEPDFHGQVSTVYAVSDGEMSVDVLLEFVVTAENDPPALQFGLDDLVVSVGEFFAALLPLDAFVDVDGDALSFAVFWGDGTALTSMPGWLSFDPQSGWLTGAPPLDIDVDVLQLSVLASDPSGSTVGAPLLLRLNPPTAPLLPSPIAPTAERSLLEVVVPPLVQSSGSICSSSIPASSAVKPVVSYSKSLVQTLAFGRTLSPVLMSLADSAFPVVAGSIGFGPNYPARLLPRRVSGDSIVPRIMIGGGASDRYAIRGGGFTAIADSPFAAGLRPSRDAITGLQGDPSSWSAQRVGMQDWLISRATRKKGKTFVLLADPLGRLNSSHRLEDLHFKRGSCSTKRMSVKKALRQFNRLDPIGYDQLPGRVRSDLEALVGDMGVFSSFHDVISEWHPSALS